MLVFRPFRNTDPPALVEIWNAQPKQRSLAQPMTVELFERSVLSKPYFDRQGLIVAVEESPSGDLRDDRPLAFCHAGFGFREDGQAISRDAGAIHVMMSRTHSHESGLRPALLKFAENYLAKSGAKTIHAGSSPTCDAYYYGLLQNAPGLGVLASDAATLELFRQAGYVESERVSLRQRRLTGFRPVVDRTQIQLRRGHNLEVQLDAPPQSWREACSLGAMERTAFSLFAKAGNTLVGRAVVWDMSALAASWGVSAMCLSHCEIIATQRRQGLGSFLMGELMRQLQTQGAAVLEAQAPLDNPAALAWLTKLGFEEIDRGVELVKTL